jgi:sRNA-binding carbon storage regulator CsrA
LIVSIGRSRVRVGIRAPLECRVLPGEDLAQTPDTSGNDRQDSVTR